MPGDPVAPGGDVRIEVMVSNGALAITVFDPDRCAVNPDQTLEEAGYPTQLRVDPEWTTRDTREFCIGMTESGAKDEMFEFVFTAPEEEGIYEIRVSLFLPNTGVGSNVATRAIRVAEDGATDPDPHGVDDEDDEHGEDSLIEQATMLAGAVSVVLSTLVILLGLAAVS